MAEGRHQRVKELFQRAVHLDGADREEYLRQTCGGDESLLQEVESLLAHHQEKTLLLTPSPEDAASHGAAPTSFQLAAAHEPGETRRLSALRQAVERNKGRLVLGALLLVLLVAFDLWTYEQVQTSLDRLLADQLQTVLDADVTALRQWLAAVETDAQMWAERSRVREAALALVRISREADDPAVALRESSAHAELLSTLSRAVRDTAAVPVEGDDDWDAHAVHALLTHRRFDGFAITSTEGRIVGGHSPLRDSEEALGGMISRGRPS